MITISNAEHAALLGAVVELKVARDRVKDLEVLLELAQRRANAGEDLIRNISSISMGRVWAPADEIRKAIREHRARGL